MTSRAVLIGAPGKAYELSVRYRYRGKHSARQTFTVTAPANLEATNAAAIDGQGALATANQVNLGASGRVYRDDGTTRVTDALAITSLGTAAAITGQGALATASAATWASQVSGRPTELTDGRVAAALDNAGDLARNITTGRRNSSNILGRSGGGDFTGELAADVTLTHTAAAITGQGALATMSAVLAAQLAAGVGKNCVIDGDFRQPSGSWNSLADSGSPTTTTVLAQSVRYRQLTGTVSSVGHHLYVTGNIPFPCAPGERLEISAYFGTVNCGVVGCGMYFFDAAGAAIGFIAAGTSVASGAGTGALSSYQRNGGFITAPASTVYAAPWYYAQSSTTSPTLRVAAPYLGRASANQTELTPWNIGFEAVPGADITLANTAAAITSQGTWATRSNLNVNGGASAIFSATPYASRTTSSLTYNSVTWNGPNGTSVSVTGGTMSGLSASTYYHVFWDITGAALIATTSPTTYYTDATGRYLSLGGATTGSGGGGGGGGGGGIIP